MHGRRRRVDAAYTGRLVGRAVRVGADVVGVTGRQAADLPDLELLKHICVHKKMFVRTVNVYVWVSVCDLAKKSCWPAEPAASKSGRP